MAALATQAAAQLENSALTLVKLFEGGTKLARIGDRQGSCGRYEQLFFPLPDIPLREQLVTPL